MMEKSSLIQIKRESSIEKEPRTLNVDQIQFAREAALDVLSTNSTEEALRIFTEGLEPVVSVARQKRETTFMSSGGGGDGFLDSSATNLSIT